MNFAVAAFRIEIAGQATLQQVEIEVLVSHEGGARTAASLGSPREGLYTSDSLVVGVPDPFKYRLAWLGPRSPRMCLY
jgi:hypothetical protein